MKSKSKDIVLCGVFAAIICICSVISLPVGVIPVTLGTFGVMLTASVLGVRKGFFAVLVFILTGAIGIPVFSGFQGGVSVLAGPTGGYITGYILMPFLSGLNNNGRGVKGIILNLLSLVLCYICGTGQFVFLTGADIKSALALCVAPFVVFDVVKAFAAATLAQYIKARI